MICRIFPFPLPLPLPLPFPLPLPLPLPLALTCSDSWSMPAPPYRRFQRATSASAWVEASPPETSTDATASRLTRPSADAGAAASWCLRLADRLALRPPCCCCCCCCCCCRIRPLSSDDGGGGGANWLAGVATPSSTSTSGDGRPSIVGPKTSMQDGQG